MKKRWIIMGITKTGEVEIVSCRLYKTNRLATKVYGSIPDRLTALIYVEVKLCRHSYSNDTWNHI